MTMVNKRGETPCANWGSRVGYHDGNVSPRRLLPAAGWWRTQSGLDHLAAGTDVFTTRGLGINKFWSDVGVFADLERKRPGPSE